MRRACQARARRLGFGHPFKNISLSRLAKKINKEIPRPWLRNRDTRCATTSVISGLTAFLLKRLRVVVNGFLQQMDDGMGLNKTRGAQRRMVVRILVHIFANNVEERDDALARLPEALSKAAF